MAEAPHNYLAPDEVLAQSIAHACGWLRDGGGHLYDHKGVWVARDLSEAARAMRACGWLSPKGSVATGVAWRETPHDGPSIDCESITRQVHAQVLRQRDSE